jgi:basic membrane lipoprotein Med (substrate-binding protein (PBP1-ABC) superfamily)
MKSSALRRITAAACLLGAIGVGAAPAGAQSGDVKEKPAIYTYVSNWAIPRARWEDMDKATGATQKVLDAEIANGTILAYGDGTTLVHDAEGATHDGWWVATSMAGALNALEQMYKTKNSTTPVLASATKHWDDIYISRYYGWKSGTVKGGYVHGAVYSLKPDAPDDAVGVLSKSFIVPLFEKLIAEGSVQAYQVATQSIHTQNPGLFFVFFITPNAESMDKVDAALGAAIGANPLAGPALGSMVDFAVHRDSLGRENATFK